MEYNMAKQLSNESISHWLERRLLLILAICLVCINLAAQTNRDRNLDLAIIATQPDTLIALGEPFTPKCTIANYGSSTVTAYTTMNIFRGSIMIESWPGFNTNSLNVGQELEVSFPDFYPNMGNTYYRFEFTIDAFPLIDDNPSNNGGYSIANVWSVPRQKVLMELASGIYGDVFDDSYGAILAVNALDQEHITVLNHQSFPPYDCDASLWRREYYNITDYPTAVFDGTCIVDSASTSTSLLPYYNPALDQCRATTSPVELQLYGSSIGNIWDFQIRINRIALLDTLDWRLFVAVRENNLPISWMGLNQLDKVTRYLLPDQYGLPVEINPGSPQYLDYDFMLLFEDYVYSNNCDLVAWLQDPLTKRVIQAQSRSLISLPQPPVSNDEQYTPALADLELWPNPVHNSASYRYYSKAPGKLITQVFNLRGQVIQSTEDDVQTGMIQRQLSLSELETFGTGVYFIRISSNGEQATKRIIYLK